MPQHKHNHCIGKSTHKLSFSDELKFLYCKTFLHEYSDVILEQHEYE